MITLHISILYYYDYYNYDYDHDYDYDYWFDTVCICNIFSVNIPLYRKKPLRHPAVNPLLFTLDYNKCSKSFLYPALNPYQDHWFVRVSSQPSYFCCPFPMDNIFLVQKPHFFAILFTLWTFLDTATLSLKKNTEYNIIINGCNLLWKGQMVKNSYGSLNQPSTSFFT